MTGYCVLKLHSFKFFSDHFYYWALSQITEKYIVYNCKTSLDLIKHLFKQIYANLCQFQPFLGEVLLGWMELQAKSGPPNVRDGSKTFSRILLMKKSDPPMALIQRTQCTKRSLSLKDGKFFLVTTKLLIPKCFSQKFTNARNFH